MRHEASCDLPRLRRETAVAQLIYDCSIVLQQRDMQAVGMPSGVPVEDFGQSPRLGGGGH